MITIIQFHMIICEILIFTLLIYISNGQAHNLYDHQQHQQQQQQCLSNHGNSGYHYDSYGCSTPQPSSPTDFEILMAIKKSLNDWNRRQKHELNHNNHPQTIRIKRDQSSMTNGDANHGDQQQQQQHQHQQSSSSQNTQQQVCYEHFGCFRHKGPFDYLNTLPASPESIGTSFSLHTRRNPIEGEQLDYNDDTNIINTNNNNNKINEPDHSLKLGKSMPVQSTFNNSNSVVIIIHGFGSSSKRPWVQKMTEVLLKLDDFNIINVDWQNGSKLPNYVQAVANTQLVGKQIARLIRKIERVYNVPPSRFHLIGFSLGAHVAGFTGQEIVNISRITGLDPASPLFEGYPPDVRLDPSDAQFVDVIHSNGDGFIRGGLGVYEPMGSVDFYPNGGRVQLGCSSALGALTNILYNGQWNLLCNHRRAFRFFIDSVHKDCTFRAFSCTSYEDYVRGQCFTCGPDGSKCSMMGYFANSSKGRGPMYLITRDRAPFCVNQFRVQIKFSSEQGVTWGQIELQMINADGMNETFVLTQEVDQLKESDRIQGIIVAHPKMLNISEVTLTYTKYRGWIYYGLNEWHIDRIELLDSNFNIKTYCRQRIPLLNTVPIRLKLSDNNCTISGDHDNLQPFSQMNSNDVPSESQNPPRKTDKQSSWSNNLLNDYPSSSSSIRPPIHHLSPMIRPKGSSSDHPIHVSYDYEMINGQSPLEQQLPRHYYARTNGNLDLQMADVNKKYDHENQSSNFITPILNSASKIFWKLWTNINLSSSSSSSFYNYSKTFEDGSNKIVSQSAPGDHPTFIEHPIQQTIPVLTTSVKNSPITEKIFILSPFNKYRNNDIITDDEGVNELQQSTIDNNNDDNDDDSIDSSDRNLNFIKNKQLHSTSQYVLYSIIPIPTANNNNNNNNDEQQQRQSASSILSLSTMDHHHHHHPSSTSTPMTTTTAAIALFQPIHLFHSYNLISTNNDYITDTKNGDDQNNMMSTTMMTPTVIPINRNNFPPSTTSA